MTLQPTDQRAAARAGKPIADPGLAHDLVAVATPPAYEQVA